MKNLKKYKNDFFFRRVERGILKQKIKRNPAIKPPAKFTIIFQWIDEGEEWEGVRTH